MRLTAASLLAGVGYTLGLLTLPSTVVLVLLVAGSTCVVMGVDALAGAGWALIASGCIAFGLAAILARGAARG